MKKLSVFLLSLCLALSLVPTAGLAAEGTTHTVVNGGDLRGTVDAVSDGDLIL